MATIYNSDLTKGMIDNAGLQTSRDKAPTQLAEKVVPVMEVNPKLLRRINVCRDASKTTTGATTLYTTPSNIDFFLTNLHLSWAADAANDGISAYISFIDEFGVTRYFLFQKITLTATQQTNNIALAFPMKLARGTNIQYGGTFAAGTARFEALIAGYTVDVN